MSESYLGFKIDSSAAPAAAVDLDKLVAAAVRVENAADKVTVTATELGASLRKVGTEAQQAAKPIQQTAQIFQAQDEHVRAFRMELERLTMKYRPMAQATQQYEQTVSEINRAHKLGVLSAQEMTAALDRERMAYERLKTSATTAGAAVKAANSNQRMGLQGFNAANASAQFQDIGVTAAMGMNPLMIGLQQGTQLASVVSSMERPVMGLAGAFASLISPVSLVTIGLTAGVAALIQYFTTADDGAEKTNEELARHAAMIGAAAQAWGDAVPQLQAYNQELEKTNKINDLIAASQAASGKQWEEAASASQKLNDEVTKSLQMITAYGDRSVLVGIIDDYNDLKAAIADHNLQAGQADKFEKTLSDALKATNQNGVLPLISSISRLLDVIEQARDKAKAFSDEAKTLTNPYQINIPDRLGNLYTRFFPGKGQKIPTPTDRPPIELEGLPDANRNSGDNAYKRAIESSREQVEQLQLQAKTAGMASIAADTLRFKLDLLSKAFSDGKTATADQAVEIDKLTASYQAAAEAAAKAKFQADLAFQDRQLGRSTQDQQIASQLRSYGMADDLSSAEASQLRARMMAADQKAMVDQFSANFASALLSQGGSIGEKLGQAILTSLMDSAQKQLTNIFSQLFNAGLNSLMGTSSLASPSNAAIAGGSNVVAKLLSPANDNASTDAFAAAIKKIESGGNYGALGPVTSSGDRAYGAYQVMGNNIGPWSEAALGRRLTPSQFLADQSAQDAIFNDQTAKNLARYGNYSDAASVWHSGRPLSAAQNAQDMLGTRTTDYVSNVNSEMAKLSSTTAAATENVGTFGNGLGSLGQQLSVSGTRSAGGFDWSSLLSPSFKPTTTLGGFLGYNANGTDYWRGGLSVVGEQGPELVNLPRGSQVHSNTKSLSMMRGGGTDQPAPRPQLNVYIQGASGDAHVRELARQGAQEAIYAYNENQIRVGVGHNQQKYSQRKG